MAATNADRSLEQRTIARASARLVPFLSLCFFVAYLDRVNVGFAALTMNRDLGLSASAYGFGAGVFFLSYSLFEVPSNLFLERVGARRWIARIMLTWGILSGATAFIQGETSFYVVRLLLGIAEAGFFPGIIFYLTLWFPAVYRARIIGAFLAAVPLATVIGAPVSGALLGFDGVLGLRGWQWLFLLEAVPALVLSVVAGGCRLAGARRTGMAGGAVATGARQARVGSHLQRDPGAVQPQGAGAERRLFRRGREQLRVELLPAADRQGLRRIERAGRPRHGHPVRGRRDWSGVVGEAFGRKDGAALPSRRRAHAGLSTAIDNPVLKIAVLCAAGFGIFGSLPVFWTLPTSFLGGAAAAGGIALINSIGNLSGFVAPYAVGRIKDATGGYTGGLLCVAGASLVATVITLMLDHDRSLEHAPGGLVPEPGAETAR